MERAHDVLNGPHQHIWTLLANDVYVDAWGSQEYLQAGLVAVESSGVKWCSPIGRVWLVDIDPWCVQQ